MTKQRWGATPEEWDQFSILLDLTKDLLPVVSNPGATISPKSKMRDMGKTPSRYNKAKQVAGIPNWTAISTLDADIKRFRGNADYGMCLQTRDVRALDVDVPDPQLSLGIVTFINNHLGSVLPMRYRSNSGKCLLAFRVPGEFGKRTIKVEGGMVEFLANGQQFIAAGTHPTGARYEWNWNGNDDFPLLTMQQSEEVWFALVKNFGIEAPSEGGLRRKRQHSDGEMVPDATLDYLEAGGHVLGYGKEGQAFITCPFEAEHTCAGAESSTAYFQRGTRGYEQGHFACLHAHCASRPDMEFLDALGVRASEIVALPDLVVPGAKLVPLEDVHFERDKDGAVLATVGNLYKALERADICGVDIRLDTFRDEIMCSTPGDEQWRPFLDADYVRTRITLETGMNGFLPIGREMMRDVTLLVANDNQFDSAIAWGTALVWDGVPRVATFLRDCFGAEDTPYTRAVSEYAFSAMAGRLLHPGIKADMALILQGEQGVIKSSAIEALSPAPEFFCEVKLDDSDDNLARKMRGCLVAELAELSGMTGKRELESIKAFIVRKFEKWVPKYREFTSTYGRRLIFFGTSNSDQFLYDETGNRRWLPFKVTRADVERIRRDRDQLWAEGIMLFQGFGVMYQDAERLAPAEHGKFMVQDGLADIISDWLAEESLDGVTNGDHPALRTSDIAQKALRATPKELKGYEMRVSNVLKKLGYERYRDCSKAERPMAWRKITPHLGHTSKTGGVA